MQRFLPFVLVVSSTPGAQTRAAPLGPPPEPPGRVSGHVYAADTNQPVRFADISLEPVPSLQKSALAKSAETTPTSKEQRRITTKTYPTSLDGSFTLRDVAPGHYFVIVKKLGYIQPRLMFTEKMLRDASPDMQKLIHEALTEVTVDSNQTAQAELRIQRGAEVSGRVLYDDGSPAAAVHMQLLQKDEKGKWVNKKAESHDFSDYVTTDDTGRYHFAALLPGEYLAETTLSLEEATTIVSGEAGSEFTTMRNDNLYSLDFFGDGTALQADAKPLVLAAGEQRDGVDMTLPISKLVRVTGHIAAGRSPHFVNAAKVELVPRGTDHVLASTKISRVDDLFHFEYVPPGDYTLRVSDARDVTWVPAKPNPNSPMPADLRAPEEERVDVRYGNAEQPLVVNGDQTGITITVSPDAKPTNSESATAKP